MIARRELIGGLGGVAAAGLAFPRRGQAQLTTSTVLADRGDDWIGDFSYVVTRAETVLLDVARDYNCGILEVSACNPGIDPWVPGPERLVLMPTAHLLPQAPRQGIVINKSELRLYFFRGDGGIETFAIGVGREGHDTPVGSTKIVRKAKDPVWRPTDNTRRDRPELPASVPPGPDNPLGDRAMYMGWPTYVIHGTNKPYGVGRFVSRGCIRMYPEGSRKLYELVDVGAPVTVVEQPIKCGWHGGQVWIEVHPDVSQLLELEETYAFAAGEPASLDAAQALVEQVTQTADPGPIDWPLVEAELVSRRGIPVQITGRYTSRRDPRPAPDRTGGTAPGLGEPAPGVW